MILLPRTGSELAEQVQDGRKKRKEGQKGQSENGPPKCFETDLYKSLDLRFDFYTLKV